jgi:hypothetical protein
VLVPGFGFGSDEGFGVLGFCFFVGFSVGCLVGLCEGFDKGSGVSIDSKVGGSVGGLVGFSVFGFLVLLVGLGVNAVGIELG